MTTMIIVLLAVLSTAVIAAAVVPLAYAIGVGDPNRRNEPSAPPAGTQARERDQRTRGLTPARVAA